VQHWSVDVGRTSDVDWVRQVSARLFRDAWDLHLEPRWRAFHATALRGRRVQALASAIAAVFALASATALVQGIERPGAGAAVAHSRPQSSPGRASEPHHPAPSKASASPAGPSASDAPPAAPRGGEATVLAAVEAAEPVEARPVPLPLGKGMWFHRLHQTGASADELVRQARAAGLTHLYVRTGSSRSGFEGGPELDAVLSVAHAAGLKVVGWDFPYLEDPAADAARALAAIRYTTPEGQRIDAFSADIETPSEGVRLGADRVDAYGRRLRELAGPGYPLIGTVPNACLNVRFPYAEVARHFDAFAPMVYWITRDPAADVACNIEKLAWFGKPVLPIGQAYDPAIDNPTLVGLVPGYDHLAAFMRTAAERGAAGVSFWAWHTATPEMWKAVTDATEFTLVAVGPDGDRAAVLVLQRALRAHGFDVPVDGRYGPATTGALARLRSGWGLPSTDGLDAPTIARLVGPRP
jgi:hypothetical protein